MDIGSEPVNEEEKEIISRGINYKIGNVIVALYLKQEIFPISAQSFSFVHCLPNSEADNGILAVFNTKKAQLWARGCDSKEKLFRNYEYIKKEIAENNSQLTLVWEGRMNNYDYS